MLYYYYIFFIRARIIIQDSTFLSKLVLRQKFGPPLARRAHNTTTTVFSVFYPLLFGPRRRKIQIFYNRNNDVGTARRQATIIFVLRFIYRQLSPPLTPTFQSNFELFFFFYSYSTIAGLRDVDGEGREKLETYFIPFFFLLIRIATGARGNFSKDVQRIVVDKILHDDDDHWRSPSRSTENSVIAAHTLTINKIRGKGGEVMGPRSSL